VSSETRERTRGERRESSSGTYPTPARGGRNGESRWPLRLLALTIAMITWLIFSYIPRLERESAPQLVREIQTDFGYQIPADYIVLKRDRTVMVTVSGPADTVRRLTTQDVDVQVPFPVNPNVGAVNPVVLSRNDVSVPPDVEVLSLTPDRLSLLIDRRVESNLPVRPVVTGEPSAGARYDEEATSATTPVVLVRGPNSRIESLTHAETTPISLDGHAISFWEQAEVAVDDEDTRVIAPTVVTICVRLWLPNQYQGPSPPCPPR
jgi:YbbR domain-containing protein